MALIGKLAVGRILYNQGKPIYPSKIGYHRIIVMMKSHSKWWPLSPYYLKNTHGFILENYYQFSKVYANVPEITQYYSKYDKTIIWNHPAENHTFSDENLNENYWNWRQKGFNNVYAVRYPVGYDHRHHCLYSLTSKGEKLNYIQARKEIYLASYTQAVLVHPFFYELLMMLHEGKNLLICEVDGPHEESNPYYTDTYKINKKLISNNIVDINDYILNILLNDTKHPYGHGYCLAHTLLSIIEYEKKLSAFRDGIN